MVTITGRQLKSELMLGLALQAIGASRTPRRARPRHEESAGVHPPPFGRFHSEGPRPPVSEDEGRPDGIGEEQPEISSRGVGPRSGVAGGRSPERD